MTDSARQPTGAGAKHRHHIVPRFYLDGFTSPDDPGTLYMYEKGRPGVRALTPRVVAFQEHFYTAELLGGERDSNVVENVLSKLEGQAAPILRKTLKREELTAPERYLFAYFVATMYLRVPHFRSVNQQIQEQRFKEQMRILVTDPRGRDWIEADIRRQEEETGRTCSTDDRDFLERTLVEGSFTFEIWPEDSMRLLPVAEEWGHDLESMQWTFLVAADDAQFVTSDNPLVLIDTTDPQHAGGLRERTTEVTFALDRAHALVAVWGDGPFSRYVRASKSPVREINRRAVRAAARFIFSPYSSGPLDQLVQQHVDSAPRPESTTFALPGPEGLEYLRHTRLVYGTAPLSRPPA